MSTKINFISLGCDKNLIDSEIMLGLIRENNYEIVSDETDADIIIVNSCGFIADANEEAIENILRAADLKKEGKCRGIIVTGCMAQRYKEEIFRELPEVDAVVGTGDFENIASVIKKLTEGEKRIKLITDNNRAIDNNSSLKRIITTAGGFSYLKIAEGCDNFCTYCTIPYLRGKYRSRPIESLIEEAKYLVSNDVREIILIAQDTSLYGTDLYGECRLPQLLAALSEIEELEWIRILYCYPEHITDEIINAMADNPKVCRYLDMPIQHADNRILKLMGRRSTKERLEAVIKRLREKMPDICLRTTLITGFPTESEENFKNLCSFISDIKFDRLGVFAYSREENTPAYSMEGQIDEETKIKRKNYILEMQKSVSMEKCRSFIGKTLKVIVEGKIGGEENVYCGRSYRDCYEIDGYVFFESEEELIAGDFYNIKITDSSDYDLIGEIVNEFTE